MNVSFGGFFPRLVCHDISADETTVIRDVTSIASAVCLDRGCYIQVEFWSQHVSFILVGVIVITSIRGLLITFTKVVL